MSRKATNIEMADSNQSKIKIGVTGCTGRVGSLVCREILTGRWGVQISLIGGTIKEGFPGEGSDIGSGLNLGACGAHVTTDPGDLFAKSDVVIDFTVAEAACKHAWLAAKHHTAYVLGTTGLSKPDEKELLDASRETAIVYAPNMSIGVNLLMALVEQTASRLGEEWDVEIFEAHHKYKADAPSGTALALGKIAAEARGENLDKIADFARHGKTGKREKGRIGFAVSRGGNVVGEHTVTFYAEGERIEVGHKASNRALFARGAVRAAIWASDKKPGLYNMRDVLGL
jgi:4-hydroxy-tetrahydrodipicolinate reductase